MICCKQTEPSQEKKKRQRLCEFVSADVLQSFSASNRRRDPVFTAPLQTSDKLAKGIKRSRTWRFWPENRETKCEEAWKIKTDVEQDGGGGGGGEGTVETKRQRRALKKRENGNDICERRAEIWAEREREQQKSPDPGGSSLDAGKTQHGLEELHLCRPLWDGPWKPKTFTVDQRGKLLAPLPNKDGSDAGGEGSHRMEGRQEVGSFVFVSLLPPLCRLLVSKMSWCLPFTLSLDQGRSVGGGCSGIYWVI